MLRKNCILFILLTFTGTMYCQTDAAVQLMSNQQSPLFIGAGEIGAAIPSTDASGFYLNPAQLGNFSRTNNFSLFFMPQKTEWMSKVITMNSYSAAAGYNFADNNKKLPLSIGVGYYYNKMDFEGLGGGADKFDCFSIGAGYDYYLSFNVGFSVKSFSSKFVDYSASIANKTVEATGNAFDLGVMITAPVSKLIYNDLSYKVNNNVILKPKFDITIGYSATNIGDRVTYSDPNQSDPLPRNARLGYTLNLACDALISRTPVNIISYSFTAEAEDFLVKYNPIVDPLSSYAWGSEPYKQEYQGPMGDISVSKNLIELKGDKDVVVHKGHIFNFFETVTYAIGNYNGNGYQNIQTDCIGVSSAGIFKLLNACVDNKVVDYITDHFSVEYYNTNFFKDTGMETNMKGIVLNCKGLIL
jgi:hypothetical protein